MSRPSSSVLSTLRCLLLLLVLVVVPAWADNNLLWSFNYNITGSLYSVTTCGLVLTGSQLQACSAGACHNILYLQGVRNATVQNNNGLETAHVTNIGSPNATTYSGANEFLYLTTPYLDNAGTTLNFDTPFTWGNGQTASSTNIFYVSPQYVEWSSGYGFWQNVSSSSFALTLINNNTAATTLPAYNGQCASYAALPSTSSSSSSTGGVGNATNTAAPITAAPASSFSSSSSSSSSPFSNSSTISNMTVVGNATLLWLFNYTQIGSLYTVSTCGLVLTGPQQSCGAGPCYSIVYLQGVRNASVFPSVAGAGIQSEHVTNVGSPNTTAYTGANELLYLNEPHLDGDGTTLNFDTPFTWNNKTASSTNIYNTGTSYGVGQYIEWSTAYGVWQTVYSSQFTLTLLSSNTTAYGNTLPQYNGQCAAPVAFNSTSSSSSSSTGGAGSSTNTGAPTATTSSRSSSSSSSSSPTTAGNSTGAPSSSSCYGAGYDFSSVAAYGDLTYIGAGTAVYVRLCGNVSVAGACGGQVCQGALSLSTYDPSQAEWFANPVPNTNVTQRLQDGTLCTSSGFTFYRESELVLSCNAAATIPFISGFTEVHTCYYQIVIQTAAACATSAVAGPTGPYGGVLSTWYDSRCGGGKYNLSSLSSSDLSIVSGGYTWYLRVCGAVNSSQCAGTASPAFGGETAQLCQVDNYYLSPYTASYYSPASQLWTSTTTGLQLYMMDGQQCPTGYNREMLINFVCNPSASSAYISTVAEVPTLCYYTATVQTSLVCSAATLPVNVSSSSSSSTGGAGNATNTAAPTTAPISRSSSSSSSSSASSSSTAAAQVGYAFINNSYPGVQQDGGGNFLSINIISLASTSTSLPAGSLLITSLFLQMACPTTNGQTRARMALYNVSGFPSAPAMLITEGSLELQFNSAGCNQSSTQSTPLPSPLLIDTRYTPSIGLAFYTNNDNTYYYYNYPSAAQYWTRTATYTPGVSNFSQSYGQLSNNVVNAFSPSALSLWFQAVPAVAANSGGSSSTAIPTAVPGTRSSSSSSSFSTGAPSFTSLGYNTGTVNGSCVLLDDINGGFSAINATSFSMFGQNGNLELYPIVVPSTGSNTTLYLSSVQTTFGSNAFVTANFRIGVFNANGQLLSQSAMTSYVGQSTATTVSVSVTPFDISAFQTPYVVYVGMSIDNQNVRNYLSYTVPQTYINIGDYTYPPSSAFPASVPYAALDTFYAVPYQLTLCSTPTNYTLPPPLFLFNSSSSSSSSTGGAGSSTNTGAPTATTSSRSSSSSSSSSPTTAGNSTGAPSSSSCYGAGYDFSSVAAYGDLTYIGAGTAVYVRLCGNVSVAGACGGQVCQGALSLSTYDPSQAEWFANPVPNTNVTQRLQDGTLCTSSGFTFYRESELVLSCNAAATIPFISGFTEVHTCYYQIVIQTAAACATSAVAGPTGPYGGVLSTWYDSRCGGGKYNLTPLQSSTLSIFSGGFTWYLRVCGAVNNSLCASTASSAFGGETAQLCQVDTSYDNAAYTASYYAPASQLWTTTSTGLQLYMMDGQQCPTGYNREMLINFVCNPSATTAYISTVAEVPALCYYTVTVQTSLVCAAALTGNASSSSSSSSSSTGAASNTALLTITSSSSSSTASLTPTAPGATARSSSSSSSSSIPAPVYPAGSEQVTFTEIFPSSVNINSPAFSTNLTADIVANLARLSTLSSTAIAPYVTVVSLAPISSGARRLLQTTTSLRIVFIISNAVATTTPTTALALATLFQQAAAAGTLTSTNTGGSIPSQMAIIVAPISPGAVSSSSAAPAAATSSSTGTRASAVGDPLFAGFQGQRYQIHGIDGAVYALLSQPTLHMNARFVFLGSGVCPVVSGITVTTNCWSHPGSYFGALSFQTVDQQLEVTAGSGKQGLQSVVLNGRELTLIAGEKIIAGEAGTDSALSITILDSHSLLLETGNYAIQLDNSDLFLNLAQLRVLDWSRLTRTDQPHGLLGQSWTRRSRAGKVNRDGLVGVSAVVQGDVDEYVIADDSMLGTDFMYSRFGGQSK